MNKVYLSILLSLLAACGASSNGQLHDNDLESPLSSENFIKAKGNTEEHPEFLRSTVQLIDADGDSFCSGTLSAGAMIFTAAHCLMELKIDTIKVRLFDESMLSGTAPKTNDYAVELIIDYMNKPVKKFNRQGCEQLQQSLGSDPKIDSLEKLHAIHDRCAAMDGHDFAVLKLKSAPATGLPFAELCKTPLKIGDTVYSFNYPDGALQRSKGKIHPGRTLLLKGGNGLLTSAYIGPGSSGGSLFNEQGQLCGLTNSQQASEEDILKQFITNFAEPVNSSPMVAGAATSLPFIVEQYELKCLDKVSCFR